MNSLFQKEKIYRNGSSTGFCGQFLTVYKIAVTGKQTDSKEKLYKSRIAEKGNGSDGISIGENQQNVYDRYFYAFQQKWKEVQKKKGRNNGEIWQKSVCRWETLYKQGKEEI